jgi:hypothetical protein
MQRPSHHGGGGEGAVKTTSSARRAKVAKVAKKIGGYWPLVMIEE